MQHGLLFPRLEIVSGKELPIIMKHMGLAARNISSQKKWTSISKHSLKTAGQGQGGMFDTKSPETLTEAPDLALAWLWERPPAFALGWLLASSLSQYLLLKNKLSEEKHCFLSWCALYFPMMLLGAGSHKKNSWCLGGKRDCSPSGGPKSIRQRELVFQLKQKENDGEFSSSSRRKRKEELDEQDWEELKVRMGDNGNPSTCKCKNGAETMGTHVVSQKIKNWITMWATKSPLMILPEKLKLGFQAEIVNPYKAWQHYSQQLRYRNKCPLTRWMDRENMVYVQ